MYILCSAMTEKIVGVLKRMKCPHRLEPHQVQGLDFIHIYPVVQVNQILLLNICLVGNIFLIQLLLNILPFS